MGHPRLQVASPESLADAFAREFTATANEALARRGRCVVAIPGGSAAEHLLPRLAREPLPWEAVHVFWCDERAVPVADSLSNAGAAALFLAGTRAAGARFHPMPADGSNPAAAADQYAADLRQTTGDDWRLDLVLLGVGEDGHIASLFPGHPALSETRKSVLPIFDAPKSPPRRMTLTLPVLAGARLVVVAAFGAGKAEAIRDAVEGDAQTPVARILEQAGQVVLLLDEAAASLLGRGVIDRSVT